MLMPLVNQFSISKLQLKKDGLVNVHYEISEVLGNESYSNKFQVQSGKDCHPDLRNLFTALAPIAAQIFGLLEFQTVIESKEFKATKEQLRACENLVQNTIEERISVMGITAHGEGDKVRVILTALLKAENGQKVVVNSPQIRLSGQSWGFEDALAEILANIELEAYSYIFKGKRAQLELFSGGDEISSTEPVEEGLFF